MTDDLRNRLRQQEAIARLGSLAIRTRELTELLDTAVSIISEVLDAPMCHVLELLPNGELLLRAGVGWSNGLIGQARVEGRIDSPAGYTLMFGQPVIVHDLAEDTRFTPPSLLHDHGVVSGMSVVILGRGGLYGVIGTHTREPRIFSADDTNFLVSAANVLADFIRGQQAEEQLHVEQTFSETLLHSLPGLVTLIDEKGALRRWNTALERMTGYASWELVEMRGLDLFQPGDRAVMEEKLRTVFSHGQASVEVHLRTKDGGLVPCLFSASRFDARGESYALGVGLDLSERRQLEAQLRQSQKVEALGQLAGGVAHDFNNMLTVISGFGGVLLSAFPAADPHHGDAQAIVDAAERAAGLTRQLLAFSRQTVLDPKVLNLNASIGEMSQILARVIGEDVTLTTRLDPALANVRVDPGLFGQAIMNLVVNARDAMPKGGRLTIETQPVNLDATYAATHEDVRAGAYSMVSVTDTGTGMSADVKARIFEPFFTTKGLGRGTGLGLAVVHGIVKQSGAHVSVESAPGAGTSFKLYFPCVNERTEQEEHAAAAAAPAMSSGTILLVEDEDGVRRLVRVVLQKQGYTVIEASRGKEALALVQGRREPLDLLITDVVMPGLDGREVADLVQARFPDVKVLFLSGYTDDAVVRRGILHNEVAFLQKPFSPGALAEKVRDVIAAPKRA